MKRLTNEEFVRRATEAHNSSYDYSKCRYTNTRTEITVICPSHGEFSQTPSAHLYGRHGCPYCKGGIPITLDDFLGKAHKKHGNRYDYSLVEYKNTSTKILIKCMEHGLFEQRPSDHTHGQGCPQCAADTKWKGGRFVDKAKEIHGSKYDYSKAIYIRCDREVIISCPKHGDWKTKPSTHLSGHGCPKCAYEKMTQDGFLQKAFDIHGPKYDYSKTKFLETRKKVTITCTNHGDFEQRASAHLFGSGCPECQHDKRRLTTETFIKRAKEVHGNEFDYSRVEYRLSHDKVTIVCPTHGEFRQKAYSHLQGKGCRLCKYLQHPGGYNYSLFKRDPELAVKPGIFYIVQYTFPNEEFLKIGITMHDAYTRHKSYWSNVLILAEFPMLMGDAFQREQDLLKREDLQKHRYTPRNINAGVTECFTMRAKPLLF